MNKSILYTFYIALNDNDFGNELQEVAKWLIAEGWENLPLHEHPERFQEFICRWLFAAHIKRNAHYTTSTLDYFRKKVKFPQYEGELPDHDHGSIWIDFRSGQYGLY